MSVIPVPLINLSRLQVRDRDGGVCRVTGVASESYWADRYTEARRKNVGYGAFAGCQVAHGMPWNVEQPVRRDLLSKLSVTDRFWQI